MDEVAPKAHCKMFHIPRFLVAALALWTLVLPAPARAAAASIRADRMLELDGEPFFPIGLLDLGSGDYDDWNARIRHSSANVVWEYEFAYRDESPSCRAVVDSARAGGYKLLLGSYDTLWWDDPATPELEVDAPMYEEAALDALLECLARDPDVVLGFTNRDEPVWTIAQGWIGSIDAAHIHATYRQLHARIDSTVVAMNFAPVNVSGDFDVWKEELLPYVGATDIVMHAAYPYPAGEGTCGPLNVLGWPECSLDRLADNADLFLSDINRPDQPLWMIIQAFKGIPLREARWTAYASIVHRATGIFWAGWTWVHPLGDGEDNWPVTVAVMSEISSLQGFLVGDDIPGAETDHPDVEVRAKAHRDDPEAVAFAISRRGYRGAARVRLPGIFPATGNATAVKEDRVLTAVDGWITDEFGAYEAHGYRYAYRAEPIAGVSGSPFALRAFPSPTTGSVHVTFTLAHEARVTLTVYDAAGRRMATAAEGTLPEGANEIVWEGRDAAGRLVPPGVYFLRAAATPGLSANARVLLLR